MNGVGDGHFGGSTGVPELEVRAPEVGSGLGAGFTSNDDSAEVGIVGRVVRAQHRRSREEDVNGPHDLLPLLGGGTSKAESRAIDHGAKDFLNQEVRSRCEQSES